MSSTVVSALMNIIKTAESELGKMNHASGSVSTKVVKKVSARKGRPTPHGAFTKKILEEHKAEAEAFKEELKVSNPEQKGSHLIFISNYKKAHLEEYAAFEAAWKLAHPKEDSASVSDASETASADGTAADGAVSDGSTKEKKKRAPMSDEHKAKMKAGREKKAAEKKAAEAAEESAARQEQPADPVVAAPVVATPVVAAPVAPVAEPKATKKAKQVKKTEVAVTAPVVAPVVAPVAVPVVAPIAEAEDENEFLPFKHAGANYMRLGIQRADGKHLWATGDLWASKKGQKGDYIGCLQDDGSIDKNAEEPEME